MDAGTLNCPTCGAAIASTETVCRYCHSRLATVSCPQCLGMMFAGSKFCPHCGARAAQAIDAGPALSCPSCASQMSFLLLNQTSLQECPRCFGIWVTEETFTRLCADATEHADVLSAYRPAHGTISKAPVRYRPCPACGQLMNRYNFERTSGVIIDRCPGHGVWFDRDELQRIIEFVRAGGSELARQRDLAQARREQQDADDRAIRGAENSATGGAAGTSAFAGGFVNLDDVLRRIKRDL